MEGHKLDGLKLESLKEKTIGKDMEIQNILSLSGFGYFEMEIDSKKMYLTDSAFDFMRIDRNFRGTFLESVLNLTDEVNGIKLLKGLEMLLDKKTDKISFELEVSNSTSLNKIWLKWTVEYISDNKVVGIVEDTSADKLEKQKCVERAEVMSRILDALPLPVVYYDNNKNIIFSNTIANDTSENHEVGYKYESDLFGNNSELISKNIISKEKNHLKYELRIKKNYKEYNILVDKVEIVNRGIILGEVCIHNDITKLVESENNTRKLLKANELSVDIKDIVEKIDELDELYGIVLSRIKDTVSNAKRSCFLKISEDNIMHIVSAIGYDEEYIKKFKINFNDSFAYENLDGNFNRSIITNNIKEKYGENNRLFNVFRSDLNSNITAPIMLNGKIFAILSIDSDRKQAFNSVDLSLIEFIRIHIERSITNFYKNRMVLQKSRMDDLTGVYNRRYLKEMYNKLHRNSKRSGDGFCLVVFDIDRLKTINDKYGHLAGDLLLNHFASFIINTKREVDIISRYGGDEFVGLFITNQVLALKAKIQIWQNKLKEEYFHYDGYDLIAQFSFGIAEHDVDGVDFDELMEVADKRMYENKLEKQITLKAQYND